MNDLPRRPLDDAAFVAALSLRQFRRTTEIAREMLKAGTPAALSAIRLRMAEFVREGGGAVEARGDSWRLTPDYQPVYAAPQSRPYKLVEGDGLALLRSLPDCSVDLALLDLPYGTTGGRYDAKIDLDAHFAELRRVVTPTGAIVSFGVQPFSSHQVMAAPDLFKQALVWSKNNTTGFFQARRAHLRAHEDILIFSKGIIGRKNARTMTFNPQGAYERDCKRKKHKLRFIGVNKEVGADYRGLTNCPRSVLFYDKDGDLHPYQKPVALLEYLIRTYSNAGAVVLDHTMGSGSTGVAALQTGRRFIGSEIDAAMFAISEARIEKVFSRLESRKLMDGERHAS